MENANVANDGRLAHTTPVKEKRKKEYLNIMDAFLLDPTYSGAAICLYPGNHPVLPQTFSQRRIKAMPCYMLCSNSTGLQVLA